MTDCENVTCEWSLLAAVPGGAVRHRQRGGVVAPHLDGAAAARPGADVARVGQQADGLDLGGVGAVVGAGGAEDDEELGLGGRAQAHAAAQADQGRAYVQGGVGRAGHPLAVDLNQPEIGIRCYGGCNGPIGLSQFPECWNQ